MKILLPFLDPYGRRITDSQVSGGTERFCKLINNNFDVEVLQYEFETEHDYYKKTGADKVAIRREITKKIRNPQASTEIPKNRRKNPRISANTTNQQFLVSGFYDFVQN